MGALRGISKILNCIDSSGQPLKKLKYGSGMIKFFHDCISFIGQLQEQIRGD